MLPRRSLLAPLLALAIAAAQGCGTKEAPPPTATPAPSVEPPATGHAKVGADRCKGCHRLQHDSWSGTAHKAKGLDCEGCHGGGADYKVASVMKDPLAARAAGLIRPGVDFCKRCHPTLAPGQLSRVHAHKAK
jgi:hypothetical protein